MTNLEIAKLFRSVAAALELMPGDNKFRVIAYERAADSIEHSSSEVKDLWDDGKLGELPGIGENMIAHLDELMRTGKVKHFQSILKEFPPAMFELLEINGVGPKTAYKLCKALGISKAHNAIKELEKAAKKGHIALVEGFGEDSQAEMLQGIAEFSGRSKRMLLPDAMTFSDQVVAWMSDEPVVEKIEVLGSLRRKASTVGDIDIAVATTDPKKALDHFIGYPKKTRVIEAGTHSASIMLAGDIQVDMIAVTPDSFGSLLQHFTGSKLHNIALRELALKQGLSLSEYGIKTKSGLKHFDTEPEFYHFLGLDYIPPELREGTGEIELAQSGKLPALIEVQDIKGDLQIHSNIDVEPSHDLGASSLEELAKVAQKLGYEYIGVTEHNPSASRHKISQVVELIKMKTKCVHDFNQAHENKSEKYPYIFNGLEIDIQPNGLRSLPDECLADLDYACVSIHTSFRQSRKAMTQRVLRGLDHPKVKFLAHPTARLLQEREGIELDWDAIFDFCIKNDKWLEVDSWPNRLDLPDVLVKEFISKGGKITIDTDSHSATHLNYMKFGVWVARRGWATKSDVINTLTFAKLVKILGKEVT
jgi:DNA polymerase (family 10)